MRHFWQTFPGPRRPRAAKLSRLTGLLALVLVLSRLVRLPGPQRVLAIGAVRLTLALNAALALAVLLAAMVWTGMDDFLRDHPAYRLRDLPWHALLPTAAVWALEATLLALPLGPLWWLALVIGLSALVVLLLAEFIVVDTQDPRALTAMWGLQAVGYGLYLLLALALRAGGWRLLWSAPLLAAAAWAIARRLWALRAHPPKWGAGGIVALVIGHLAVAWFYTPVGPLAYSLLLLGALYALVPLLAEDAGPRAWHDAWNEPLLSAGLLWLLAVLSEVGR